MIEKIDANKCTGCGICVEVCPLDTIRLDPFQEEYPPCRQSCPAGVDVRGFLFYFKQGMLEKASTYLEDFLPFPAITGLLCHHPCETACARKGVDEAINIHGLEHYIGTSMIAGTIRPQPLLHAGKVAVIGSGPAGLSSTYFMRKMGYEVTVFESSAEIGGSLLKEVGEERLPMDVLDAQIKTFQGMGISFVHSRKLSGDLSMDDLRDQRYRAILLATGFSSSLPGEVAAEDKNGLDVDPETLQTNMKGVFACGALLSEKMSLVAVIASARKAAESIDRFLIKEDLHAGRESGIKKVKRLPRDGIEQQPRFDPDEGLDEVTAPKEAHRCMSCGSQAQIAHPEDCMTCFECEVKCPSKTITVHPFKEVLPMTLAIE